MVLIDSAFEKEISAGLCGNHMHLYFWEKHVVKNAFMCIYDNMQHGYLGVVI
jgi:hypothetical protein